MRLLRGLFIMDAEVFPLVYGPEELRTVARFVETVAPLQHRDSVLKNPSILRDVELIFSGWAPPVFDDAFVHHAPNLKAIFNAAGPRELGPEGIRRGIQITTAHVANSQPVAEYALAAILFSLKHGWSLARQTREQKTFVERNGAPGCYRSTIGIISLGMTGRLLVKLLRPFDLQIMVYDPTISVSQARELGVEKVSLADLFSQAHVVSVHAPHNGETAGMVTGKLLSSMRSGATFINTARGGVVVESEMIKVAQSRPDLQFVLDVTEPEPPVADSPLFSLPNVMLTPHIAGSAGGEIRRMGHHMIEELGRFMKGEPLKWCTATPAMDVTIEHEMIRSLANRHNAVSSRPV